MFSFPSCLLLLITLYILPQSTIFFISLVFFGNLRLIFLIKKDIFLSKSNGIGHHFQLTIFTVSGLRRSDRQLQWYDIRYLIPDLHFDFINSRQHRSHPHTYHLARDQRPDTFIPSNKRLTCTYCSILHQWCWFVLKFIIITFSDSLIAKYLPLKTYTNT